MSKSKIALAAGLVLAVASPAMAERLSKEQLIALAIERETCGKDLSPIDAYYQSDTVILVTCGDATGFVPQAGGLGLGAGAVAGVAGLALVAGGGGDATAFTTTASTN